MAARLVVTQGPVLKGNAFPLSEGAHARIGREAGEIIIPDTQISRTHCQVQFSAGRWLVRDLGSTNGTLLNGAPVTVTAALRNGDILEVGETRLRFEGPEDPVGRSPVAPSLIVPIVLQPIPCPSPAPPAARRPPWVAIGVAVLLLAAAGVATVLVLHGRQSREAESAGQAEPVRPSPAAAVRTPSPPPVTEPPVSPPPSAPPQSHVSPAPRPAPPLPSLAAGRGGFPGFGADGDLEQPWRTFLGSMAVSGGALKMNVSRPGFWAFALYPEPLAPGRVMECEFRHESGKIGFIVRYDPASGACQEFLLGHEESGGGSREEAVAEFSRYTLAAALSGGAMVPKDRVVLAKGTYTAARGEFHRLRVDAQGVGMRAFLDGVVVLDAADERPEAPRDGGIGFSACTVCSRPAVAEIRSLRVTPFGGGAGRPAEAQAMGRPSAFPMEGVRPGPEGGRHGMGGAQMGMSPRGGGGPQSSGRGPPMRQGMAPQGMNPAAGGFVSSLPVVPSSGAASGNWLAGQWSSMSIRSLQFQVEGDRIVGGSYENASDGSSGRITGGRIEGQTATYEWDAGGGVTGTTRVELQPDGSIVQRLQWEGREIVTHLMRAGGDGNRRPQGQRMAR